MIHERYPLIPPQPPPLPSTPRENEQTGQPPQANFSPSYISGYVPIELLFFDQSVRNPTHWLWDFGDQTTSTLQNPRHTYSTPGVYAVTLTASNQWGQSSSTKKIAALTVPIIPIVADFVGDPLTGTAPLEVTFTDLSTGTPTSWEWDFDNNGSVDSTLQNPTYTYNDAGLYTVKLTASKIGSTDSEIKVEYIEVISGGGGCELAVYDWFQDDPYREDTWWDINVDGTLFSADLIFNPETEGLIKRAVSCGFMIEMSGVKSTCKFIYRNESNSYISCQFYEVDTYRLVRTAFTQSLTSKSAHINMTGEWYVVLTAFNYTDDPADTQNWIECWQVEEHDWTGEATRVVIYD